MCYLQRVVVLILATSFLLGCGYIKRPSFIQNRNTEYLSARTIPPLRIPPGVSSDAFENYYPIPDRYYPEQAKTVSIVPPGLENQ